MATCPVSSTTSVNQTWFQWKFSLITRTCASPEYASLPIETSRLLKNLGGSWALLHFVGAYSFVTRKWPSAQKTITVDIVLMLVFQVWLRGKILDNKMETVHVHLRLQQVPLLQGNHSQNPGRVPQTPGTDGRGHINKEQSCRGQCVLDPHQCQDLWSQDDGLPCHLDLDLRQ